MTIDPSKTYIATLKTAKGQIVVELNGGKAPETVNNFVNLARKGYYNNSTFHRVLPGFMAQGGDPTGTGAGGPGYTIPDEFTDLSHEKGVISMANKGQPRTGGSQFFITYVPTPWLDGKHTVFGVVISGMQVAESLTPRDPNQNPGYLGDRLLEVTIEEKAPAAAGAP
jgi:cyclophilin family peptidyl-prolyl cis-trans isomerase